jgi:Methyltransferase FkbM domain
VPTVTIDSFFNERSDIDLAKERLLFKIDVEGYEPFVIEGMQRLLQTCGDKVGILEFNTGLLRTGGINARDYLDKLAAFFPVALVRRGEQFQPLPWQTVFDDVASGKEYVTDLLLVSHPSILAKMGLDTK